jgi:hypothetical protein
MENLAAIVSQQTNNTPAPTPTAPRGERSGTQVSAPQSALAVLFAIPEGEMMAGETTAAEMNNDEPAADSELKNLPEPPPNHPSTDNPSPNDASTASPRSEARPAEVKTVEVKAPEVKAVKEEVRTKSDGGDVASAKVPGSVQTPADRAPSGWLPDDKRSCRALAGDGPIF